LKLAVMYVKLLLTIERLIDEATKLTTVFTVDSFGGVAQFF
jgi:hypothetical protein